MPDYNLAIKDSIRIEDFNPGLEVSKLIKEGFDPDILNNIDESDMPIAKNFVEWIIDKRFFNLGRTRAGKIGYGPYAKQLQIGLQLHEEYCPDCTDPRLLVDNRLDLPIDLSIDDTLDRVELLEYGICPRCKKNKLDFLREGKFYAPHEFAGCCGQRGGKSAWVVMDSAYVRHRIVMIHNPQKFYGLFTGSPLLHTFTASTYSHADELLWQPFKAWCDMSPWFKEYHKLLNYYENKFGEKLFYDKDTYYLYKHKRITGYCEAPNIRRLRGPTRFYASIDEVGWLDSDVQSMKIKTSAEGIYTALNNSLETIRSAADGLRKEGIIDPLTAFMSNISSPSDINDKIMRQVKAANTNKRIIAVHLATWEFNPRQSFEKLRNEHKNDLIFWRDFGAVPPFSTSPFFTDIDKLDSMCSKDKPQSTITLIPQSNEDSRWVEARAHPTQTIQRILTIDAGENYNSFAGGLSHYDKSTSKVIFDALFEIEPIGRKINFEYMFEHAILPICEKAHVVQVVFDQWQSLHQIHALNNRKMAAERYSLKWADFANIQECLIAGLCEYPKLELPIDILKNSSEDLTLKLRGKPVIKLMWQILTVRQAGKKVIKPQDESGDDIFRVMCLALAYWLNEKTRDALLKKAIPGQEIKSTNRFLGSFYRKGGANTISTSNVNQKLGTFYTRKNEDYV